MNDFKDEVWKALDLGGFVNGIKYEISNCGRIRSYAYGRKDAKILKGGRVQGYPMVAFTNKKGERVSHYVHKLIASHFIPNKREKATFVLHLDYDKENNHVDNLKWATKLEKEQHLNLNPKFIASKSKVKHSKLSESDVLTIKKLLARDEEKKSHIARRYNITHTQLNRIRRGENWGHVVLDEKDIWKD
ncbi:MAG TPA: hypothetical protein DCS15_02860 [Flavobacteriales bacterium]|jgi:hypothetical protein|nr:hypothetical protein [Flavobacteriales bacterium]